MALKITRESLEGLLMEVDSGALKNALEMNPKLVESQLNAAVAVVNNLDNVRNTVPHR